MVETVGKAMEVGAFGYTTILLLNCNTVTRTHHAAPVQLYPNP